MTSRKWLVAAGILCLFTVAASADWERTISAWDTRTPDQGKLQLSLWGGYWAWGDEGVDGNDIDATLYANYGIADNWAVALVPQFTRWDVDGGDSEAGIADTGVMSIYRFLNEAEAGLDLAVMGRVWLPTGDEDKGLGSGHVEPELKLMVSKALGPFIAVANAGGVLVVNADEGEKDVILSGEVEGVYPLSEKLSLNAAFSAATARDDGADDTIDLGVGARLTPQEQMFVLGGIYYCLTDAYDWGIQVAAGYEF